MRSILLMLFLVGSAFAKAQSLNNYKYIVVANQYEFQNAPNEYRLNELMEFELQKYGFETYRSNEVFPEDMNKGGCNTLQLQVDKSGTLWTDVTARLEDCTGITVFTTETFRAREKSYDKAYFSGVRGSFKSFEDLNYNYEGKRPAKDVILEAADEVERLVTQPELPKVPTASRADTIQTSKEQTIIDQEKVDKIELPVMDFKDTSDAGYAIQFGESQDTFQLYQHGAVIGTGRKSAAGVYLVTSSKFTGIGFVENDQFIIEYDKAGKLQRIVMVK